MSTATFAKPIPTHRILAENANLIWKWFQERGGIVIWHSADLSDPSKTWTGPMKDAEGNPPKKENWKMEDQPREAFTDPMNVWVDTPKEIKRFHVAIRRGTQGMCFKCTDASSARIEREVAKRQNSWYEFDYDTQEAVIYVPGKSKRLPAYIKEHSENGN